MTDRTVDAKAWIARQPKTVRAAGEARGQAVIREVTARLKARAPPAPP